MIKNPAKATGYYSDPRDRTFNVWRIFKKGWLATLKGYKVSLVKSIRSLRIQYDGAVYHITSRGNARKPIYKKDEDRRIFLEVLHRANTRYNRC
jgi:hypothetical protein